MVEGLQPSRNPYSLGTTIIKTLILNSLMSVNRWLSEFPMLEVFFIPISPNREMMNRGVWSAGRKWCEHYFR